MIPVETIIGIGGIMESSGGEEFKFSIFAIL
jgi:hypothetical protein